MNDLARAELYRDALHDLPDYDPAQQCEIDALAVELCEQHFDRLDKESLRAEWVEEHWQDYIAAATDQMGLI